MPVALQGARQRAPPRSSLLARALNPPCTARRPLPHKRFFGGPGSFSFPLHFASLRCAAAGPSAPGRGPRPRPAAELRCSGHRPAPVFEAAFGRGPLPPVTLRALAARGHLRFVHHARVLDPRARRTARARPESTRSTGAAAPRPLNSARASYLRARGPPGDPPHGAARPHRAAAPESSPTARPSPSR